jgi:CHAT domain-containing protein/TolA-binding protein
MRTIGTVLCLLALTSTGGGLSRSIPRRPTSQEAQVKLTLGRTLREASLKTKGGDYQTTANLFLIGSLEARRQNEPALEARFLWGLANCHFAQRRYQEALTLYLDVRDRFKLLDDRVATRAVEGNIASLYSQIGEVEAAIEAMKRATDEDQSYDPTGSRTRRLITLSRQLAQDGKFDEANRLFRQGIIAADRIDDPELLSNAWDRLGGELLSRGRLAEAEDALLEAFRIRKLGRLPSLAGSYGKLGLLRLAQGDRRSASALLDASIRESKSSRVRTPEWRLYHARGRLRLSEGRIAQAYTDFRLALELVRNYRLKAPSSDATRVSLEGVLQEVYSSFVQTGARLYVGGGGLQLARDTFQALEENRASSLVNRVRERRQLRRRMPQLYWDTLEQLQSAESAALLDDSEGPRRTMRRLRSEIAEMEVRAGGAGFSLDSELLPRLQHSLDRDSALLSFHLGEKNSWLWAVSALDVALYSVPNRASVTALVNQLQRAVVTRDASGERLGRELYRTLFGGLEARYRNKSRWLLSLDEGLFQTPFAALVVGGKPGVPVYLIERHTIRTVSSAANLSHSLRKNRIAGSFIGIGDPIYNAADNRWRGETRESQGGWLQFRWSWRASAAGPPTLGLSRLPGANAEIDACAREWRGKSILLKGRDVTRENVRRMARGGPAILHFATHILQDRQRSTDAQIALSLSDKAQDELLGPSEIGSWSLDIGLVVLSGCSSGVAVARPGAGLMGMTRAWLAAGAAGVVATSWSTPDDAGPFFQRFYRELQRSEARDPAEALRTAQIETIRSGGWRSDPAYWSAYFVLGNY